MSYTGNNPKLTMIHDRELIDDAKQQLHRADEAYKSSPARQNQDPNSPIYMTEDPQSYRSSLSRHWQASNPMYDMPIIHDEADGSPAHMHDGTDEPHPEDKKTSPRTPGEKAIVTGPITEKEKPGLPLDPKPKPEKKS